MMFRIYFSSCPHHEHHGSTNINQKYNMINLNPLQNLSDSNEELEAFFEKLYSDN